MRWVSILWNILTFRTNLAINFSEKHEFIIESGSAEF